MNSAGQARRRSAQARQAAGDCFQTPFYRTLFYLTQKASLSLGLWLLLSGATLYVAPPPTGSDANPGTVGSPKATIQAAATLAMTNNAASTSTTIYINPGTYRESILMSFTGTETTAPIVFEAVTEGAAIISGSDVYTGWTDIGGGVYSHSWANDWGLAAIPGGWEGAGLPDIARRREQVFVNGVHLTQVLTLAELSVGEFFVDEPGNLLKVFPPAGTVMASALVEVAIRPTPFSAFGKDYVTLKGLVFQHNSAALQGGAVLFSNCDYATVDDNQFLWNNWAGFATNTEIGFKVRGNTANHNGGVGMLSSQVKSALYEDNITNFNNWRGNLGGFTDWGVGGVKHLFVHDTTYRRHVSRQNETRGFWLDTDVVNTVIEEGDFSENLIDGMFLEALQGPVLVRDSRFEGNLRDGLLIGNVALGSLLRNRLEENLGTQIRLGGSGGTRTVTNWETLAVSNVWSEYWTWRGNQVSGSGAELLFVTTLTTPPEPWAAFVANFTSTKNTWTHTSEREAWTIPGGSRVDLGGWQALTGEDADSRFRRR